MESSTHHAITDSTYQTHCGNRSSRSRWTTRCYSSLTANRTTHRYSSSRRKAASAPPTLFSRNIRRPNRAVDVPFLVFRPSYFAFLLSFITLGGATAQTHRGNRSSRPRRTTRSHSPPTANRTTHRHSSPRRKAAERGCRRFARTFYRLQLSYKPSLSSRFHQQNPSHFPTAKGHRSNLLGRYR